MKNFPSIRIDDEDAAHRQITTQLRALILDGQLKLGTRLPGLRELAEQIGTNYFTVQAALTPLVGEGLIERRPRHGTVVIRNSLQFTSVGIYFGAEISQDGSSFYPGLYDCLFKKLQAAGIEARLFIDSRRLEQQGETCPHILKAIQNHEIQGVLGGMLLPEHNQWLNELPVPVSLMTTAHFANSVKSDNRQMVRAALRQLADRGCKTVEMLPHRRFHGVEYGRICEEEALAAGVELLDGMEQTAWDFYPTKADYGYQVFKNRWHAGKHPDALMVYPDPFIPGVITAILEAGIHVPEELKLIFSGNRELPMHCPLSVDWLMASISEMADAMIGQLQAQLRGAKQEETWITSSVVQGY